MSGTTENVDFKATADTAAVLTALQQIAVGMDKIAQSTAKIGHEKRALDSIGGSVEGLITNVLKLRNAFEIASKAHQLFSASLEDFHQRNREVGAAHVNAARGLRAYQNIAAGTVTVPQADQRAHAIARATGNTIDVVAGALEETIGSSSDLPDPDAPWKAVLAAGRHFPGPEATRDDVSAMARGITTLQRGFPGTSAEQALAMIDRASKFAPQKSLGEFVTNILPAIVKARSYGNDQDEFVDLASTIIATSTRSGDQSGRTSANWYANFNKQLKIWTQKELPDATLAERLDWMQSDPKGQAKAKALLGPFYKTDRPAAESMLSSNPKMYEALAKRLVGDDIDLKSEAKQFISSVELLQPSDVDNITKQTQRKVRSELPNLNDRRLVETYRQTQLDIEASPLQQAAKANRALSSATTDAGMRDVQGAVSGTINDRLDEFLRRSGIGWFDRKAEMISNQMSVFTGTDPVDAAELTLNRTVMPKRHRSLWNDQERERAASVGTLIEELRQIQTNSSPRGKLRDTFVPSKSAGDAAPSATSLSPTPDQSSSSGESPAAMVMQRIETAAEKGIDVTKPGDDKTRDLLKAQRDSLVVLTGIARSLEKLVASDEKTKQLSVAGKSDPARRATLGIDQAARSPN